MAQHQISAKDAKEAVSRLASMKRRFANMKEHTAKITHRAVQSMEVSAAAFATGVMQGRTGGIEIIGIPVELAVGGVLQGIALFGGVGDGADHLANVGNGMLAAYAAAMGRGVGDAWKSKAIAAASAQGQTQVKGVNQNGLGAGYQGGLSPDAVLAAAQRLQGQPG